MSSILIKNANIINPDEILFSNILIQDGRIAEIGNNIEKLDSKTTVIDAAPFYVIPGGIDPHVHLELPVGDAISSDTFESGSIAALFGGTTTLIDFVTPEREEPLLESLCDRRKLAEKSFCDFGLHGSITSFHNKTKDEMRECAEKQGVTSFKTYMAYKKTIGINDYELISILKAAGELNVLVTIHCENGDAIDFMREDFIRDGKYQVSFHPPSRPENLESEAVNRAIILAALAKASIYIVHVSSGESVKLIKNAQISGQSVFGETCPHYLLLDESLYQNNFNESVKYVMSPPLRKKINQQILWDALKENILNTCATDHCPFNYNDKIAGKDNFTKIPNGVPGIEDRMSLIYSYGVLENRMSLNEFVNITSTNAAKIFGLYPQKGILKVGSDADIVLWNKDKEKTISAQSQHQNCDTNIYENFKIKGIPELVISNGKIVINSGNFFDKGRGKYIYRKRSGYKIS